MYKTSLLSRTIIAIGYNISMDKPPARIRAVRLPNDPFLQSNGYKPAPLDLSAIELSQKMEELVDLLAENTHNLWAKERIGQGWTYGLNEDTDCKRSPHLLPYMYVDEAIKIANRNTASETVRTLLVYGYVLDPPTGDLEAAEEKVSRHSTHRTYRAEKVNYNTYLALNPLNLPLALVDLRGVEREVVLRGGDPVPRLGQRGLGHHGRRAGRLARRRRVLLGIRRLAGGEDQRRDQGVLRQEVGGGGHCGGVPGHQRQNHRYRV